MLIEYLKKIPEEEWERASKRALHYLRNIKKINAVSQGYSPEDVISKAILDMFTFEIRFTIFL